MRRSKLFTSNKGYSGEWDSENMGKMLISPNKLTVTHGGDFLGSYQCVRGSVPISSGVCYWELNIDKLWYIKRKRKEERREGQTIVERERIWVSLVCKVEKREEYSPVLNQLLGPYFGQY